jgi:hypothetical protein
MEAQIKSTGTVSTGMGKERNSIRRDPLPSVNDILDIAENESKENAISSKRRKLIGLTISH